VNNFLSVTYTRDAGSELSPKAHARVPGEYLTIQSTPGRTCPNVTKKKLKKFFAKGKNSASPREIYKKSTFCKARSPMKNGLPPVQKRHRILTALLSHHWVFWDIATLSFTMKNKLSILMLLMIGALVQGQAKNFKGYVIYPNQEKTEVLVSVPMIQFSKRPDYQEMQSKITIIKDNSPFGITPDQVLEVAFTYDEVLIRMISVRDELKLTSPFANLANVFLKLEEEGAVRLFRYYQVSNAPGAYNNQSGMSTANNARVADRFVVQRSNGPLVRLEGTSFKKDVAKFFHDCPDVIKRVKDKEYKKEDLELVVKRYNKVCGKHEEK